MEVELLYLEDCPNWQLAGARRREALRAAGQVPVILAGGRDRFAGPGDRVRLALRLWPRVGGDHSRTVRQFQAGLADAA